MSFHSQKHHARVQGFLPATKRPFFLAVMLALLLLAPVSATWWNSSYGYKSAANVTLYNSSNLADFAWNITVDTASLISGGKLDSGCQCLAFVNGAETAVFDYDLDNISSSVNGCNKAATTYWVASPVNATPWIYYGATCPGFLNATPFDSSTTGAVLHMGENGGSSVYDYSGNDKDWPTSGTIRQNSTGVFGYATYFDKVAYITQSSANLGITSGVFTFTGWMLWDAISAGDDYDWLRGDAAGSFRCYTLANKIQCNARTGWAGNCDTGVTPTLGQWYHIGFTVQNNAHSIFVNGERKCTVANTAAANDPTTMNIAKTNGGAGGFFGSMDEVRIYKSVLPDYEIMRLYRQDLSSYAGEFTDADVTPPIIDSCSPANGSTLAEGNVQFRVNASDNKNLSWLNQSDTFTNLTIYNATPYNATAWFFTIASMTAGTYEWEAWANDTAGNSATTGNCTLIIVSTTSTAATTTTANATAVTVVQVQGLGWGILFFIILVSFVVLYSLGAKNS